MAFATVHDRYGDVEIARNDNQGLRTTDALQAVVVVRREGTVPDGSVAYDVPVARLRAEITAKAEEQAGVA